MATEKYILKEEQQNKIPPVKEGDIAEVEIKYVGIKKDGIAKIDGFTIIVPNTSVGDIVSIRITKLYPPVNPTLAFAEVM